MKRTLTVLMAAALCAATAATAADTIKIGVAGAHSGDLASYGIPSRGAAELVAKEVNAKGGLLGKKIELIVGDDMCKPEMATNVATKLTADGATVVLGHICSGATKAALGIYKDKKVIVISPSATNPALTQSGDYPNFFRTIAPDDMQARLGVDFAVGKLGAKKVAVLHDKGDYGKGYAEFAKMYVEKTPGVELVLFEGITPGAMDYSAIVQKIKQSGADVVLYGGYHPEASKIVSQMRSKKMKTLFVSDDGVKDDTFVQVAGADAEGVYASGPKDVSALPLNQSARKAYEEAYKEAPGAFYQEAYAAMLALVDAIRRAGSTDYAAVEKALRSETVDTPVGRIGFDAKGDAVGVGFSMYRVENGKYVEQK